MTVKELREKLKDFPEDAPVLMSDSSEGPTITLDADSKGTPLVILSRWCEDWDEWDWEEQ